MSICCSGQWGNYFRVRNTFHSLAFGSAFGNGPPVGQSSCYQAMVLLSGKGPPIRQRSSYQATITLGDPPGTFPAVCILCTLHHMKGYTHIHVTHTHAHIQVQTSIFCSAVYISCLYGHATPICMDACM